MGDSEPTRTVDVRLDEAGILRRVLVLLVAFELLLVYLDVVVAFFGAVEHEAVQDVCNIVLEGSLPGWFSSVQTLVVSLVVLLIALRVGSQPDSGRRALGWGVVAVFFFYMALDDGSGLHEAMGTAFEDAGRAAIAQGATGLGARLLQAFPSYPWQILFVPTLGAMGAFTLVFSHRQIPRRSRRLLIFAGIAIFAVAVGLDFIEGMQVPYERIGASLGLDGDTIPHASGLAEEFLEDFGTTLVLYAYLGHLLDLCRDVRLRVD